KIYTKKTAHVRPGITFGQGAPEARPADSPPMAAPAPLLPSLPDVQKQAERILLTHYSPVGLIINKHLEVLHFRGHTGPFLEHAHGDASLNLLKMAREGLTPSLRSAVMQAIKQNVRVHQPAIRVKQNGHFVELAVEVIPYNVPP